MSFVSTAKPPVVGTETPVENHPWFPAISPDALRKTCRLDGTVTPDRLRLAVVTALRSVNGELREWREAQQAGGYDSLAAVPCDQLDGESEHLARYRQAVYSHVLADMAEAYRDISTTPSSDGKGDRIKEKTESRADAHRQTMRWAISDILGIGRTTVELI
ncbi:MAG: head completion/stabilization protein [Gammaproteobacteria bacterium]|uniref:Putative head completion protein n=1 Tax=viral metagenome TaxID=1070528 RepID=A0A6M3KM35_9ZZZZ|nr:head completion/stabilization protein [Gammaproteobacteria bacterium]MBU1505931.1 head completion/stabilization protein [Gammaproteobacteria bacterium]MBU2119859.1 head completion/stabilization protein [Gammaproteobacteria bacterium]MBU2189763.1 head completion/stabilization protein [Gammaproteobacteria bacterium]